MLQYDRAFKGDSAERITWKLSWPGRKVTAIIRWWTLLWNVSQIIPEWQSFRKLHFEEFRKSFFLTTRVWSCTGCWTQLAAKLKVWMDVWTNEWSSVFWNVSQKVKHDRPTSTTGYLSCAYIGAVIEHKCTAMTQSIGSDRWFRTMTQRNLF